ncbi:MAG TPA: pyridoxal phosphate-dependent aminotransferase [Candidatus Aquilonibacter sp.]|nr:pyridoxal phosphate-dependent aminotransferase [Candidatus Aquilonibacter sp.]
MRQRSENSEFTISSRRSFLRYALAAAATPILTEAHFARAAQMRTAADGRPVPPSLIFPSMPAGAVLINANENPLGPCQAARERIAALTPAGGRYDLYGEADKLIETFASQHHLKPDHVAVYAGSSEPLFYTVLAFTSPSRSLVIADPSYEWGMMAAGAAGAPIHKIPLTGEYAHDVKTMVSADPNAGVIYICNPNNPTGTLTSKQNIVWALGNKPRGSVLLVDEAYIHFADAPDVLDLVAADKDIVVLRTFSKVYGMAGLRCGLALARPDLLAKLRMFGENFMPILGTGPANASLLDAEVVPTRKKIIGDTRRETIAWLRQKGYKVIGESQSNCFMIDTGRDGRSVMAAMQQKNIFIGRTWPVWPNAVRITVGTPEEMAKFRTAFKEVMDAPPVAAPAPSQSAMADGVRPPRFTRAFYD